MRWIAGLMLLTVNCALAEAQGNAEAIIAQQWVGKRVCTKTGAIGVERDNASESTSGTGAFLWTNAPEIMIVEFNSEEPQLSVKVTFRGLSDESFKVPEFNSDYMRFGNQRWSFYLTSGGNLTGTLLGAKNQSPDISAFNLFASCIKLDD